jgi:hypothetical protein
MALIKRQKIHDMQLIDHRFEKFKKKITEFSSETMDDSKCKDEFEWWRKMQIQIQRNSFLPDMKRHRGIHLRMMNIIGQLIIAMSLTVIGIDAPIRSMAVGEKSYPYEDLLSYCTNEDSIQLCDKNDDTLDDIIRKLRRYDKVWKCRVKLSTSDHFMSLLFLAATLYERDKVDNILKRIDLTSIDWERCSDNLFLRIPTTMSWHLLCAGVPLKYCNSKSIWSATPTDVMNTEIALRLRYVDELTKLLLPFLFAVKDLAMTVVGFFLEIPIARCCAP